ncbi:MAG: hypothetical protein ACE14S_09310, partial [Candidatus Bathyarchaeia archaeon]
TEEKNLLDVISDFLMANRNRKGIIVTSNRPASDLIERLQAKGIGLKERLATNEVCIVDLVSRSVGAPETKGCIYTASPSELSAAQMAIENAFTHLKNEEHDAWLLLDSVSTLIVFNGSGALLHFLHFLIGRLRVLGFSGAIVVVEGSVDEKTLLITKQFCDKVMEK